MVNNQGRSNPEQIKKLPVLKQRIKILEQSESKSKEIVTIYSFLIIFITVVMLLVRGLASGICNAASNSKEVHVGSEIDFPPYALVDKSGKVDGFSVELIKAVANTMGLSIKISTGSWNTMWNSLVSGQIDVLPIVAKLPERQRLVSISAFPIQRLTMPSSCARDTLPFKASQPPGERKSWSCTRTPPIMNCWIGISRVS
ncbi:MAG: transporter substrate-binding domain-containing protein [Desulfobacterales bacterium]|nr:transporter substrate-binding domain-containing protein [Desulfobacterales bacterium]